MNEEEIQEVDAKYVSLKVGKSEIFIMRQSDDTIFINASGVKSTLAITPQGNNSIIIKLV